MQLINALLAISLAISLVSASHLDPLSNEKRQADDYVVWVTVTSICTVTSTRFHHYTTTLTIDLPPAGTPPAQTPVPVAPSPPHTSVVPPANKGTPPSTGSPFSGQATYYAPG